MFKKQQNLCKSVIDNMKPKSTWQDDVFLAEQCKERFLTVEDIPEMRSCGVYMGEWQSCMMRTGLNANR